MEKSGVFFYGVQQTVQEQILQELHFVKADIPIRYLGVAWSTKRVLIVQCKPLIDKIIGRITSWTTKFLSYSGRAQLVKSVLFAIQVFWAQILALPNKVIKVIQFI